MAWESAILKSPDRSSKTSPAECRLSTNTTWRALIGHPFQGERLFHAPALMQKYGRKPMTGNQFLARAKF
jgi:hypothetical protein